MGFEVVPNSPYRLDLASSDFRMSAPLRNLSDEMKFKQLRQYSFENSLQSYMALGLNNLFKAGGVILNKETTLKNEVQKLSTHSELCPVQVKSNSELPNLVYYDPFQYYPPTYI
jgi:hypothetical protein